MWQLFIHYLSEIDYIKPNQIKNISNQLIARMYGVTIQTHIMKMEDMCPFYELGVKCILKTEKQRHDY